MNTLVIFRRLLYNLSIVRRKSVISLEEETIELKRYLKKLQYVIEQETKFTLINARIVDKKKVDDILCCIESSFPETYKNFIKEKGPYKLKSSKSLI